MGGSLYSLVIKYNDKTIKVKEGSLQTIDNFIATNKIYSITDLFNFVDIDNSLSDRTGEFDFQIIYKHNGETKSVPLLYKNDVDILNETSDKLNEYLFSKLISSNDIMSYFENKILNKLYKVKTNIGNTTKDLKHKMYLFKNNSNSTATENLYKTFLSFCNSYYFKKKNPTQKELNNAVGYSEREELYNQVVESYSSKRKLFINIKYATKTLPQSYLYNYHDEFEELLKHDNNPDTDRMKEIEDPNDPTIDSFYNEEKYENDIEFKHPLQKVKTKNKSKEMKGQISMFDN